jgi:hypothetical protein
MARLVVHSSTEVQVDLASPGSDDVLAGLAKLAGRNELELTSAQAWLEVAGGPDRFFVAYSRQEEGAIWQMRGDGRAGDVAEFMVGGQPTTLPSEYLVPLDVATAAVQYFLATDERLPTVEWDSP